MAKITRLIALKPCSFGGKKFYIGDEIPAEFVSNPSAQVQMGTIASVEVESEVVIEDTIVIPEPTLSIIVKKDDEELTLEPTDKGIQAVFNVLIGKTTDAEAIISKMDDEDALILLHLSDSRRTVREMAETRAKELTGEQ